MLAYTIYTTAEASLWSFEILAQSLIYNQKNPSVRQCFMAIVYWLELSDFISEINYDLEDLVNEPTARF